MSENWPDLTKWRLNILNPAEFCFIFSISKTWYLNVLIKKTGG